MSNGTCASCKHSVAIADPDANIRQCSPEPQYQCRRWPPSSFIHVTPTGTKSMEVRFPMILPTWWCGEFTPRLAVMS